MVPLAGWHLGLHSLHPWAGRGHRGAAHVSRTYLGVNHFTLWGPWFWGLILQRDRVLYG